MNKKNEKNESYTYTHARIYRKQFTCIYCGKLKTEITTPDTEVCIHCRIFMPPLTRRVRIVRWYSNCWNYMFSSCSS
jgi:hypothetical protein